MATAHSVKVHLFGVDSRRLDNILSHVCNALPEAQKPRSGGEWDVRTGGIAQKAMDLRSTWGGRLLYMTWETNPSLRPYASGSDETEITLDVGKNLGKARMYSEQIMDSLSSYLMAERLPHLMWRESG